MIVTTRGAVGGMAPCVPDSGLSALAVLCAESPHQACEVDIIISGSQIRKLRHGETELPEGSKHGRVGTGSQVSDSQAHAES